ncbi:hypothetical protein [Pseudodesulfovibrio thermohalotolerans]|uniref:hypothetical protein n=1 Tax=Pseudodesulfovibrio thermohalotolerans TaxID=2880651 RepID=UPI00384D87BE
MMLSIHRPQPSLGVHAVLAGEFRQGVFAGQGIQDDSGFEFRAETFSRLGHELPPSGNLWPPYRVIQFSEATSNVPRKHPPRANPFLVIVAGHLFRNNDLPKPRVTQVPFSTGTMLFVVDMAFSIH